MLRPLVPSSTNALTTSVHSVPATVQICTANKWGLLDSAKVRYSGCQQCSHKY